jgi:type I restriction enzyme S subunit
VTWPNAVLGDIATIERASVSPSDIETGSKYVGLEHIESGGGCVSYGMVANGDLASSKFRFTPDHILFGKLRPYLAKIADPGFEGICSTDILPILPGRRIDKRFLLHFLRRKETVGWASSRATGINLPRLSPKELLALEVPLPRIDEQRRIAAILDKADALRRKRKHAIELLDSLSQSIFVEMFGDIDAPIVELKDVVRQGTIITYGIVQAGPEFTGGVPYIRTGDLIDGEIDVSNLRHTDPAIADKFARSRVRVGDIVMSIRATVGTTAVVPAELDGANLTQGTARIAHGDKVHVDYLLMYLRSENIQRWIGAQVKGATFLEITLGRLRELPVRVPEMVSQVEFARRIGRIREMISGMKAQKDLLDSLFASLQHRAFSGEL